MLRTVQALLAMTLLLLPLLLVGCPRAICDAGGTQTCVCPGGDPGAQTCSSDGSRWGDCECGADDDDSGSTDDDDATDPPDDDDDGTPPDDDDDGTPPDDDDDGGFTKPVSCAAGEDCSDPANCVYADGCTCTTTSFGELCMPNCPGGQGDCDALGAPFPLTCTDGTCQ